MTSTEDYEMKIQRIIHPHSNEPTKLMSKVYQTSKERAHVIFKPTPAIPNQQNEKKIVKKPTWNPIRFDEYRGSNDDSSTHTTTRLQPSHQTNQENDTNQKSPIHHKFSEKLFPMMSCLSLLQEKVSCIPLDLSLDISL